MLVSQKPNKLQLIPYWSILKISTTFSWTLCLKPLYLQGIYQEYLVERRTRNYFLITLLINCIIVDRIPRNSRTILFSARFLNRDKDMSYFMYQYNLQFPDVPTYPCMQIIQCISKSLLSILFYLFKRLMGFYIIIVS